jgi:peptidoglycan/LPS O-acetylase OafA/YrhL
MIYALTLALRAFVRLTDRAGALRNSADHFVRGLFGRPWLAPALLALPLAAGLLTETGAMFLTGLPTPNGTLIPRLLPLGAYSIAFALGWMLHRNVELLWRWQYRWVAHLIVAALATLVCMALIATRIQPSNELTPVSRLLFAAGYALASWCWVIAITGFALRFLSGASATRRYIADASYWIYLIHYPLVVTLQDLFATRPMHWVVKFPAIVAITLAISLLTYHFFVRYTIIGRILNGRRHVRSSVNTRAPGPPEVLRR